MNRTLVILTGIAYSQSFQLRPRVEMLQTSGDYKLLLQNSYTHFQPFHSEQDNVITIQDTIPLQQWDGIGASLTGSSAWILQNLPKNRQQEILMKLFSPKEGIGLNLVRISMGANDFSIPGNYSYDDMPNGQTDVAMAHFSIVQDQTNVIPILKKVQKINPNIKIFATPWSPPAWMKNNHSMNGGSINKAYYPSLAKYFVKFIQAYKEQRLPIYAISVQNEPLNSQDSYPTVYLSAQDESEFIANYLGPALKNAGLSNVKILGLEHNWSDITYAQTLLKSSAAKYLAGTAFHCYRGHPAMMTEIQKNYRDKGIWFTECTETTNSKFESSLKWHIKSLITSLPNHGSKSLLEWNLILDQNNGPHTGGCKNCIGLINLKRYQDTPDSAGDLSYSAAYYSLGHLGKFVSPGARVIRTEASSSVLSHTGFLNPDRSIVFIVYNPTDQAQSFTIHWNQFQLPYTISSNTVVSFKW